MSDFATLKKKRGSSLDKLIQETSKLNTTTQRAGGDDRLWKPEVDKAGNGFAVIRFLPEPAGEDLPWVRVFDHGFQGPGGWYIENSLTTIGQKDPVGEFNSTLWNNGTDAGKEQARKQKRRLKYFSNIYVVKDPANPQNEGKVMLFQYGKKIWDKINEAMNPEFEDESPINPFDFWEGADFKLKIRNVEGYRNYDKSEFDSKSALSDDDEKLEKIYNSLHSLNEFTNPKNFKPYAELEAKLNRVLGLTGGVAPSTTAEDFVEVADTSNVSTDSPFEKTALVAEAPVTATAESSYDDDDSMAFFEKLAEE
jgi:hypothetical protein